MTLVSVTKIVEFEAAHFLADYVGMCSHVHGHSYKLEVTVKGATDNGMVIDFSELKRVIKLRILDKLDHQMLNDVLPFRTTAENMVVWIVKEISACLKGYPSISAKLWETSNSYAGVSNYEISD